MTGTMKERTPGTWQLRVYAGRDPKTNNPIQLTKTFKGGKRQAQTALAAFVTEVEKGNAPLSGSTTVAELIDKYIEYQTPLRSPNTIRGYRSKAKRIKDSLGAVKVAKLSAQDLDRAYRGWLAEGLSPTTVHQIHAIVSAALNQAVRWGVVPFAVTDRAQAPSPNSQAVPEITPATVRELVVAAERSDSPLLASAIALAAILGCRQGELVGLRWSDLDMASKTVTLRRSVKKGLDGAGWIVGPTKTHQERRIALDELTIEVLRRRYEQAEKWAADAGVELASDAYILSLDPAGKTPRSPDAIGQAYRRVAERIGVKVRFHDLRHFAATQMIAAGIDVRTVAERLGHADASMTLRVYASAVEARDKDAAAVLGQLVVGQAPGSELPALMPAPDEASCS